MSHQKRVLPIELYPSSLDEAALDRVDAQMTERASVSPLPTQPGHYGDVLNDLWTLDEDGTWTDKLGDVPPREGHPILVLFGPFRRLGLIERTVKTHQRRRHLAAARAETEAAHRLFGSDPTDHHTEKSDIL